MRADITVLEELLLTRGAVLNELLDPLLQLLGKGTFIQVPPSSFKQRSAHCVLRNIEEAV